MSKKRKLPSTQQYLDIAEIKEDTVILKDGTLRGVLLVSSVNFALKSDDEQDATIRAYISFLNSLDFSVQIVVQSRKLVINDYLEELKKKEKEQTNELLKMQTGDYRKFITELVELGDIMSKRFYVVVPYAPGTKTNAGFFDKMTDVFSPTRVLQLKHDKFIKYKQELERRLEKVRSNLMAMSVQSVRLDTQSLIELYYNSYNPDIYDQQKLVEIEKLQVTVE